MGWIWIVSDNPEQLADIEYNKLCSSELYSMFLTLSFQEFEANIEGMKLDKVRVEQEEKRKTLAAETQQHQQVKTEVEQMNYLIIGN